MSKQLRLPWQEQGERASRGHKQQPVTLGTPRSNMQKAQSRLGGHVNNTAWKGLRLMPVPGSSSILRTRSQQSTRRHKSRGVKEAGNKQQVAQAPPQNCWFLETTSHLAHPVWNSWSLPLPFHGNRRKVLDPSSRTSLDFSRNTWRNLKSDKQSW